MRPARFEWMKKLARLASPVGDRDHADFANANCRLDIEADIQSSCRLIQSYSRERDKSTKKKKKKRLWSSCKSTRA